MGFKEWLKQDEAKTWSSKLKKGAYWAADKALAAASPLSTLAAAGAGGYLGYNYGSTLDFLPNKLAAAAVSAPLLGGLTHYSLKDLRHAIQQKMVHLK